MQGVLLVLLSYLIGSIPFSYIVSHYVGGVDIRATGSGNVGATNVMRNLGIKVALLAFTLDLLKGFVAAWIGFNFGSPWLVLLCPAAAIIGHCYPIFLKFKGGKAVATTAGIVLYLSPGIFIILVLAFLAVVFISRYVSLGSVLIACLLPFTGILFRCDAKIVLLYFLAAVLVLIRHRENITRLRQGNESKI